MTVREVHEVVADVSVSARAANLPYESIGAISKAVMEAASRTGEQIGRQTGYGGAGR